jgi:hypothetical protein
MKTQSGALCLRRIFVYMALCLGSWGMATASEPARFLETLAPPASTGQTVQKDAAPPRYPLPASLVKESPSRLEIRVLLEGRRVARETVELPSPLPKKAAVEVLAYYPEELRQLRKLESLRPGSIRVSLWIQDRLLGELPLGELEKRGARTASLTAVGSTLEVEMLLGATRRTVAEKGYVRDPACVQQCDDDRLFCYEVICDPRGSCQYCEENYSNCVASCPQVCVDPKKVYRYTTVSYVGSNFGSTRCFEDDWPYDNVGLLYRYRENIYRERTYERTEYCNGSYSDRFISERYVVKYCYEFLGGSCVAPQGYVPAVCN